MLSAAITSRSASPPTSSTKPRGSVRLTERRKNETTQLSVPSEVLGIVNEMFEDLEDEDFSGIIRPLPDSSQGLSSDPLLGQTSVQRKRVLDSGQAVEQWNVQQGTSVSRGHRLEQPHLLDDDVCLGKDNELEQGVDTGQLRNRQ